METVIGVLQAGDEAARKSADSVIGAAMRVIGDIMGVFRSLLLLSMGDYLIGPHPALRATLSQFWERVKMKRFGSMIQIISESLAPLLLELGEEAGG
jgi:hypothetical protein